MSSKHPDYFVNGRQVPSVTQLLDDNLAWGNKNILKWNINHALAGRDPEKILDVSARIGTLTHGLIQEHLIGKRFDTSEYSLHEKLIAKKAFGAALSWLDKHEIKINGCEVQLTHEDLMYGGTIDLVATVDSIASIVDWKTSNNIYPKHRIQLAAYAELVYHNFGYYPNLYLVRLDKEYGVPRDKFYPDPLHYEWRIFEIILELHELHKMVR